MTARGVNLDAVAWALGTPNDHALAERGYQLVGNTEEASRLVEVVRSELDGSAPPVDGACAAASVALEELRACLSAVITSAEEHQRGGR